jgi:hypothetical protein
MGMLQHVKVWEAGVHYAGVVVTRSGSTYQALKDTADQPERGSKDWVCLARAGMDAREIQVRGLFMENESYQRMDFVAVNGSTFCAKTDDPGPCPGPGWQLIASQGKAGPKGERGMGGEKGERGEPGLPGAVIQKWEIDREQYVAVPIMSDGRAGPPLALRGLFEQFQIEAR